MKYVFNLYGGPGTGKDRCATGSFSDLKDAGVNAEFIPEHVKLEYAWQGRHPQDIEQFSIFGEQTMSEIKLLGKYGPDVMISCSPVYLQSYYASVYGNANMKLGFELLVKEYYRMAAERGIEHVHIWLKRCRPYNPKGRFQTEEQAKEIDKDMLQHLKESGIDFHYVDGVREEVTKFLMQYLNQSNPLTVGGCY